MKSATRAYSNAIVSAMREAGVYEAITTGQPSEISFSVAFGAAIARCELALGSFKTPDERATAAKACYDDALEQLIAADKACARKAEAMKVAVCPKCNLWFSSVEARNEHREDEHSAAAAEQREIASRIAQGIPIGGQAMVDHLRNCDVCVPPGPPVEEHQPCLAAEQLVVLAPPLDDAPIALLDF